MSEDIVMADGDPGPTSVPHEGQPAGGDAVSGQGSADTQNAQGGVGDEEEEDDKDFSIKSGLEEAFSSCEDEYKGTYADLQTYSSTPNPIIEIADFGPLGLPLSPHEAARLRTRCNPAAFGKGEQTVVDTNVRDTSELDAKHVRFLNPLWNDWLNTAVAKACDALGVTGKQYRFELYKLLLYETGSHFKLHQDTEKSPGMFGTIVVVLPTFHKGGVVRVKHDRQQKLLDSGSISIAGTSVLSWYSDVHHEVKPVEKGFRLALAFNLIFSGNALAIPRAPTSGYVLDGIDNALRVWQARERAGSGCPRRLIHILSHHYSQANLSFAHLKGADSILVNLLREAADKRGFCVALGHLDYQETGCAEDDGPSHRWGGYGDSDEDDDNVGMLEVYERKLTLQLISGTTGVDMGREQEIDLSEGNGSENAELMVDENYWKDADVDNQEYEGYQGNGAGSLDQFYHRTVVVFWPVSQNTSIIKSVGGIDACVAELQKCKSPRPTATDMNNATLALTTGKANVASMVADLALRWNDRELWINALSSCKGESNVHSFGMQRVGKALVLFMFRGLRPTLDAIVSKTMSTKERLQFIDTLEAYTEHGTDVPIVPPDWIADKRRYVLSSLRTPQLEDVEPIVKVLATLSDARTLLSHTVLPQLQALNLPHDWWTAFAARLRTSPDAATLLPDWESPVFEASKLMFDKAIQQAFSNESRFSLLTELEAAWASHEPAVSWARQSRRWAVEHLTRPTADDVFVIMDLVRAEGGFFSSTLIPALQQMDYEDAFWPDMFAHLDQYAKEDGNKLPEGWSNVVAEALHAPLVKAQVHATSNAQIFAMLDRIALAAPEHESIKLVVQKHTWAAMRQLKRPRIEEVPLLVNKLKHDVECGSTLLVPQLEAFGLKLAFWESVVKTMHAQADAFHQAGWTREQLHALLGNLTSKAIASTSLPPHVVQPEPPKPYTFGYGMHSWNRPVAQPKPPVPAVITSPIANDVKRLLVLCLLVEHAHMAGEMFRKIFTTYTSADAIKSVIVPLVPVVLSVLQENQAVAPDTSPFDQFFRNTVRAFVTTVLGRKPDSKDVAKWKKSLRSKCTCKDCVDINGRIATQNQVVWLASYARRGHVEQTLRDVKDLQLSVRDGGHGRMSSMVVDKINEPVDVWKKKSEEARALLRSIGSDALLNSIYAATPGELQNVYAHIQGNTSTPLSASTAAPSMTAGLSGISGASAAASSSAAMAAAPVAPFSTLAQSTPAGSISMAPARVPIGAFSYVDAASASAASSSTAAAVAPSASTVPKKRKAPPVDPKDVIEISD